MCPYQVSPVQRCLSRSLLIWATDDIKAGGANACRLLLCNYKKLFAINCG